MNVCAVYVQMNFCAECAGTVSQWRFLVAMVWVCENMRMRWSGILKYHDTTYIPARNAHSSPVPRYNARRTTSHHFVQAVFMQFCVQDQSVLCTHVL